MKKPHTLVLVFACFATVIALFYAWTDWWGARQLNATLKMLEENHEPLRIEQLIPPEIPDEQNMVATPVFQQLMTSAQDSPLGKMKTPWVTTAPTQGESPIHRLARGVDPSFSGDDSSAGTLVLKSIEPSAPLLAEVTEALRRPSVNWPLDYPKLFAMPLPELGPSIVLAKILRGHSLAELATGDGNKAFQDILTLLALAQANTTPPYLVANLIKISILRQTFDLINQGLDHQVWSDAQLASLESALAKPKLAAELATAYRMERATQLQINWRDKKTVLLAYGMSEEKFPQIAIISLVWHLWPAGWRDEDQAFCLVARQPVIESLDTIARGSKPLLENLESESRLSQTVRWRFKDPISIITLSATSTIPKKILHTQTLLESLRAACAVERYRLAHHQLPDSLDELIPKFLLSVPKDPMTGGPLHYKISPDGSFVIYGLGWNSKDTGGAPVSTQNDNSVDQANWGVTVKTIK